MNILNTNIILLSFVIIHFDKFVSSNRTLNILRPRRTRVINYRIGHYKGQLLSPRNTISVTTVTIGQKVVFTCEAPEKVEYIFVYFLYNVEKLIHIAVINDGRVRHVYRAYISGVWSAVDLNNYMVMKQLLLKDRKLDIAEEFDDYTFDIVRHDLYGVPAYVIYSKNEYDLVAVYDNCHLIWQQNHPNDKAAFVIVHGELSATTLINVLVKGQGESYNLYYNKNGSDWEQVTKTEFYLMLDLLDLEVLIDQLGE